MTDAEVERRFAAAIAAIDEANSEDPNTIVVAGQVRPKEQAHAELMTHWVQRLDPGAGEAQLLAARANHLRRWTLPRSSHPEGRAGYLRWRTALRKQHAAEVGEILERVGYPPDVVERVQAIVDKVDRRGDPAVQTHEDALCLVFLETQLVGTAARLGPEKALPVVQKTAAKMSPAAIAAVAELDLSAEARQILADALGDEGGDVPAEG